MHLSIDCCPQRKEAPLTKAENLSEYNDFDNMTILQNNNSKF